jgi:hypothetical protein
LTSQHYPGGGVFSAPKPPLSRPQTRDYTALHLNFGRNDAALNSAHFQLHLISYFSIMARTVYPRTVTEKAPSHDVKPCFTAWRLIETQPDAATPPSAENRPQWSIQIYDTTPAASDPKHVRSMAREIHESTWPDRDLSGSNAPDRIEVYGFPLPADTPEAERVDLCIAHQKAEIASRDASGPAGFSIPPTYGKQWRRRIIILDQSSPEQSENDAEDFICVHFDPIPQGPNPNFPGDNSDLPDIRTYRFSRSKLGETMGEFRDRIRWYYETSVEERKRIQDEREELARNPRKQEEEE